MSIDHFANGEPTEDDLYLAKLTMDEVGADIEECGYVDVTPENATQNPFTAKGSLANALDEAIFDPSAPVPGENIPEEKDPRPELEGEIEGTETGNKPDMPTMDREGVKTAKDSLSEALGAIAMDAKHVDSIEGLKEKEAQENEIGDADTPMDDTDKRWLKQRDEAMRPELPKSMGGGPKPEADGLVYLDYTFTIDPATYSSNNYQPMADAAAAKGSTMDSSAALGKRDTEERTGRAESLGESERIEEEAETKAVSPGDAEVSEEDVAVAAGIFAKEKGIEEGQAVEIIKGALSGKYEVDEEAVAYFASILPEGNAVLEHLREAAEGEGAIAEDSDGGGKKTEDEAVEKEVLDYATFIDGSSFLCFDEVGGVDYTKIAMDAGPKKPHMKPNCKTTFAQCRAKNPLYCRFHGPKLLESDIKQALTALLGKNSCTISVTKDKDAKSPMTFRLTAGCVPAMKEKVEEMVHKFMTQNPGIKSTEDWKDLGEKGGKIMETEEFEMDILQVDEPPQRQSEKTEAEEPQMAQEGGEEQPIVEEKPNEKEEKAKEGSTGVEGIVQDVAKHLYPDGKTEGVESVVELIDFKESELGKFAQESGIDDDTLTRMKEKNKVFDLLKSAMQAANEFDEAVRNGDEAEDKEGLAKKAEELKSAFSAFTESLEAVRAEMESGKKTDE